MVFKNYFCQNHECGNHYITLTTAESVVSALKMDA